MIFYSDTAIQTADSVVTLVGDVGVTYKIGLRVRGVIDLKDHTGGTVVQKYVRLGGTPVVNARTMARLTVASPAAVYYLNVSPDVTIPDYNVELDYTLDILALAGTTLSLRIDNQDLRQFRGDVDGNLITKQPIGTYDGIWLRVDSEPSEPLVDVSVVNGAGVRGWLWSAFGDNIYGIEAEK